MDLKKLIKDIPNFPKEGILFKDMSPVLRSPEALHFVANELVKSVDLSKIDCFAGIESRGFILAAYMAAVHNKGFIPIRKAGKLPPPTKRLGYDLEYGSAEIELSIGSGRIMIIDDVLATGGTLQAAIDLGKAAGYVVEAVGVLINLTTLNNLKFNGREVNSLVQY